MDEKDLIMGCSAPDLSIVIALIAGRQAALTTCLEALDIIRNNRIVKFTLRYCIATWL